jgi:hypothetical protein
MQILKNFILNPAIEQIRRAGEARCCEMKFRIAAPPIVRAGNVALEGDKRSKVARRKR